MKEVLKSIAVALSLWMVASGIILAATVGHAVAETTTIEIA